MRDPLLLAVGAAVGAAAVATVAYVQRGAESERETSDAVLLASMGRSAI